jgi:hypothetical protein
MSKIRIAAGLGMVAMLAACSENSVAPRMDAANSSSVAGGGSTADLSSTDTARFSFTIDPWQRTYYNLGNGNSIVFPAHSLCALNSTYGPSEWDAPCTQATSTVTVYAKAWLDSKGHARIDFDKHIRFVPSTNPQQWVVITFADLQASLDPFFNILYCPQSPGGCYDESKLDPSVATVRDPVTGKVTRRIKHFSGYNVAAGDDGSDGVDPTVSANITVGNRSLSVSTKDLDLDDLESVIQAYPSLTPSEADAMLSFIRRARKFSGYILASG